MSENFILSAWAEMSQYTVSDCYEQDLLQIYEKISGYEYLGTVNIEGKSVVGESFMEFYPDEVKLKELVLEIFYIVDVFRSLLEQSLKLLKKRLKFKMKI